MIEVQSWMSEAVALLKGQFGSRLLFVGLQGSHRRGEAREESDIDILTILDTLDIHDLAAYRAVLRSLPEGEKACGFTCGREQMKAWPAFELFQFREDIDAYYGELDPLLPPFNRESAKMGAMAGVSGLYHMTAHIYTAGEEVTRAEELKGVFKGFYFSMQIVHFLRHGVYAKSKRELLALLSGDEADMMRLGMDPDYYEERKKSDPDSLFQLILSWSGNVLKELAD